jgi:hypothetical protein
VVPESQSYYNPLYEFDQTGNIKFRRISKTVGFPSTLNLGGKEAPNLFIELASAVITALNE